MDHPKFIVKIQKEESIGLTERSWYLLHRHVLIIQELSGSACYDIKPVRKEEGKSYWKIPLCDDDATREK